MHTYIHQHKLKFLSLAIAASIQTVHAQEEVAAEDEIEVMSVYGSVSLFGATKSNTPILETARSLSIETSEDFIKKGASNYLGFEVARFFGW